VGEPVSTTATRAPLRRDTGAGLIGGVISGIGARTGIDTTLLRVGFVAIAILSGGLALLAYLIAWASIPAEGERAAPLRRLGLRTGTGGSGWRVAAGVGLLTLSALFAFRELGIWWSDALSWPVVLAAFGAALLWRRTRAGEPDAPAPPAWAGASGAGTAEADDLGAGAGAAPSSRLAELYRGVFGVLLVIGAALLFLSSADIFGGIQDAALTAVVVIVALGLILAPFLWRLGRSLAAERAERIRSQERAEVAAHLHDSVLQTLALVQKRADDPREVAALARRQERELRAWLAGGRNGEAAGSFAAALRSAAEEIEDDHRVPVETVIVGDCERSERAEAVIGAAREALLNAARHAPESGPVRVFAEVGPGSIEVYVRDRGPGFDPAAVPADRRGVRESILGRMRRAGGRAEIRSAGDGGTEIVLEIARADSEGGEER
jgi:signal transduction histidine kinase